MRVFYDVDSQNDFIRADGALSVPNAESIIPSLGALTQYAQRKGIKILGSVDKHFGTEEYRDAEEGELARWKGPFPDHCMQGTYGQRKIPETVVDGILYIPSRAEKEDEKAFSGPQIILEKQSYNVFPSADNPGGSRCIEKLLKQLAVTEAVLYGVATEYCDRAAAVGMRKRGVEVYVVTDAIAAITEEGGKNAVDKMEKIGVKFVTMQEVVEGYLDWLEKKRR